MKIDQASIQGRSQLSRTVVALAVVSTILTSAIALPARADVRGGFNTVALSGGTAPEPSGSATFSSVDYDGAVIGNSGLVAFSAIPTQSQILLGFWAGTAPANVTYVGGIGGPAPGTPDTFANGTDTPAVNAGGAVAALAILSGPDVTSNNQEGIWLGNPTANALVYREGSPTPVPGLRYGSELSTFANYAPALSSTSPQVAFQTGLQNSSGTPIAGAADWVTLGGSVLQVAQTGGPVPGFPPGATFTSLGSPGINGSGDVVFSGSFSNPSGPVTSGTGIWISTLGTGGPVAATGEQAFGLANGVTLQNISFISSAEGTNAHLTSSGATTVFFATLAGPGITASVNDHSVWLGSLFGGPPVLVAQQGTAAPGLPAGTTFASFNDSGIGNSVLTGILATVSGPGITSANNTGIWTGLPGNLQLLVRDGDSIPDGANAPITVAGLGHFAMNALGELVTQLSDQAIIGENAAGHLAIVARVGDSIQVAPGDFRTVSGLTLLSRGEFAGEGSPINDFGIVAFAATFTDGSSAVLTSNVLAVPEPGGFVLASLAILAVAWSRRRRALARAR